MIQTKQISINNKSYNIQLLRGLAIIAVVFIHNTPDGIAQVFCRPFLNFAVGLFLFLSGMLSDAKKWNPKKRLLKVLIPYIIWTLVYVLISQYDQPKNIPVEYLKGLLAGNSAPMMYYVFIYCEFTLLIPLIDKLARSKYKYLGFIVAPLEIILMRLLPLLLHIEINGYVVLIQGISCLGWFTYYYLGYLLGNSIIELKASTKTLWICWSISIILQMLEGYLYFYLGESNCGSQLKITSILTGTIFVLLGYKFIYSERKIKLTFLYALGNASFGIYFSHMAIMTVLQIIPFYSKYIIYPINAISVILISYICVVIGKRILGKYSKYLAF